MLTATLDVLEFNKVVALIGLFTVTQPGKGW